MMMRTFFSIVDQHGVRDKKVGFYIHGNLGFLVCKLLKSNP